MYPELFLNSLGTSSSTTGRKRKLASVEAEPVQVDELGSPKPEIKIEVISCHILSFFSRS